MKRSLAFTDELHRNLAFGEHTVDYSTIVLEETIHNRHLFLKPSAEPHLS